MNFFKPIRPLLKGWVLSFAGWTLVSLVLMATIVNGAGVPWSKAMTAALCDQFPWAVLTPLVFRFAFRFPLDRQSWKRTLIPHLFLCALIVWMIHIWKESVDPRPGPHRPSPPDQALSAPLLSPGAPLPLGPPRPAWDFFHFSSVEIPIYLMIVSGAHTVLFYRREQERAASLARARLEALKMQIQPHFLFNTLNTIAGLIHEDPNKADVLITSLSDLLRSALETSADLEIPLEREIQFVDRYLLIMRARFEDRLRYQFDVAPEAKDALVPPLILQPLVENAVRYGLEPRARGGHVTVHARMDQSILHLRVVDDGPGLPTSGLPREGIGLSNTRARLAELYGRAATLEVRSDRGVTVEITIPYRTSS